VPRRPLWLAAVIIAVLAVAGLPVPFAAHPVAASASACVPGGRLLRYLVLFDAGTTEWSAAHAIRAACATPVAYYPQIGVGVATSAQPDFTSRFGADRAYSAQAEATTPPSAQLPGAAVPPTTAQLPAAAPALRVDHSAEQWDMRMIHAPEARLINRGRPDVVVGVLDSGIDATHPDLAAAVDPTHSASCLSGLPDPAAAAWSPTTSAHGTHVAGIIAAADDGYGITGVAPGVRVASVKVVDDQGFIYPEYAVCGFMWAAAQHMRITNSSYSVDPWLLTCSTMPGQAVVHEALRRAVAYATAQGVLNVAAVGNERLDLARPQRDQHSPDNAPHPRPRLVDQHCHVLPAQLPGVVAVSAIGAQGVKADYSSYGLGVVTVAAPGGDWAQPPGAGRRGCVLSTIPGGYGYAYGTSMAAPHVAGVAALLASAHPQASPQQLAALLREQANPLPCPIPDPQRAVSGHNRVDGGAACAGAHPSTGDPASEDYGHGLVDALKAVSAR
jgi:subtilisin family serine protease